MTIKNSPMKNAELLVSDNGQHHRLMPMALSDEEWQSVWDTLDGYAYEERASEESE
jgi:hypothetical protein